VSEV
jgi:putative ABC transport system permease protein